jgi:hypothetical protein
MPQPKGHEPFSRFWTVNWKVIFKTGSSIPAGTLFSRPRSQLFTSKEAADAFHDALIASADPTVGHPAPGTIQSVFEEDFRNQKAFIVDFVNEHCAFVQVSTL